MGFSLMYNPTSLECNSLSATHLYCVHHGLFTMVSFHNSDKTRLLRLLLQGKATARENLGPTSKQTCPHMVAMMMN